MVAQPVAFAQNTRDEVRLMNGDGSIVGALAAEPGMKQTCYVAQPVAYGIDGEQNASEELIGTLRSHQSGGYEGARVAQPVAICTDMRGDGDGHTAPTLRAKETANDFAPMVAVAQPVAFKVRGGVEVDSAGKAAGKGYLGSEETAFTLAATQDQWIGQPVAIALQTDVTPKASEELAFTLKLPSASGGGQPQAVAVGTDCYNGAITGEVAATMGTTGSGVNGCGPTVMQAVDVKQVQWASGGGQVENDTAQALRAGAEYNYQFARVAMQVRRLTPVECERLQGFPDNFTNIPWRKKDEAPDGPRYKALGNSMAVPCMQWIGERIAKVTK